MNHEAISMISFFRVKVTLEFTNEFFLNHMSFKRKQAHPQREDGKGKKQFQSQLSIASE